MDEDSVIHSQIRCIFLLIVVFLKMLFFVRAFVPNFEFLEWIFFVSATQIKSILSSSEMIFVPQLLFQVRGQCKMRLYGTRFQDKVHYSTRSFCFLIYLYNNLLDQEDRSTHGFVGRTT